MCSGEGVAGWNANPDRRDHQPCQPPPVLLATVIAAVILAGCGLTPTSEGAGASEPRPAWCVHYDNFREAKATYDDLSAKADWSESDKAEAGAALDRWADSLDALWAATPDSYRHDLADVERACREEQATTTTTGGSQFDDAERKCLEAIAMEFTSYMKTEDCQGVLGADWCQALEVGADWRLERGKSIDKLERVYAATC